MARTTAQLLAALRPSGPPSLALASASASAAAPAVPSLAAARAAAARSPVSARRLFRGPVGAFRVFSDFEQQQEGYIRLDFPGRGKVLFRDLAAFQMLSLGLDEGAFPQVLSRVYSDGRRLLHGRDYVTTRAGGATRVYVLRSALSDPCEVIVELLGSRVQNEWQVWRFASDRPAGHRILSEEDLGDAAAAGSHPGRHALFRKKAGEDHFKVMAEGSEWFPAEASTPCFDVTVPLSAGDEVAVLDKTAYYAREYVVPLQAGYLENSVVRVPLVQSVGGVEMPLPVGNAADISLYLDGLKLLDGVDYVVKFGREEPGNPPFVQLANSLPPGKRLLLETGRGFSHSLARRAAGSHPKGFLSLIGSPLPLSAASVEAYSMGRRLPDDKIELVDESVAGLGAGARGHDRLEVYHSPLPTWGTVALSAWYEANLPPEAQAARNVGFASYLPTWLASNPRPDVVPDGSLPPSLGSDATDEALLARYLKYGPGGEQPEDDRFVDANDLESPIVFGTYAVDASNQSFPDLGYGGSPIDANDTGWTFSPRPSPTVQTVVYAEQAYSFTPSSLKVIEVP